MRSLPASGGKSRAKSPTNIQVPRASRSVTPPARGAGNFKPSCCRTLWATLGVVLDGRTGDAVGSGGHKEPPEMFSARSPRLTGYLRTHKFLAHPAFQLTVRDVPGL